MKGGEWKMTTDNKYNGWTNWETWNYNLHHDDQYTEQAQECYDNADADETFSKEQRATLDLAVIIEADAENEAEELQNNLPKYYQSSFFMDAVNMSLREINYYEIAENYMSDVDKTEAE